MKTLLALLCLGALSVGAQTTYQVHRMPLTGGYNVYGSDGSSQQIIRQPLTGNYNVYSRGPNGELQNSQIIRQPLGGGYNIYTSPCFGCR